MCIFFADVELSATSCPPAEPGCPDKYFSTSYFEARKKFRTAATAAGATVSSYPVYTDPYTELEYTIDAAVLPGELPGAALVHISGSHGAEGFAGSAIQIKVLQDAATSDKKTKRPTMIFIHALNPVGMGTNRRFNHNNVDLNRNWHSKDRWPSILSRDPNVAGYMLVDHALNPRQPPSLSMMFMWAVEVVRLLLQHGFLPLKTALVTGQFHDPTGLYYGGPEEQINIKIAKEILAPFRNYTNVVSVDVHTGLGPSGVDTLMLNTPKSYEQTISAFGDSRQIDCAACGTAGSTGAGYQFLVGDMLLEDLFVNGTLLEATEEFGTVAGLRVVFAVVMENAAYHTVRNSVVHQKAGRWLRNVFYVPTLTWKSSVLERGVEAFGKFEQYLAGSVRRT